MVVIATATPIGLLGRTLIAIGCTLAIVITVAALIVAMRRHSNPGHGSDRYSG